MSYDQIFFTKATKFGHEIYEIWSPARFSLQIPPNLVTNYSKSGHRSGCDKIFYKFHRTWSRIILNLVTLFSRIKINADVEKGAPQNFEVSPNGDYIAIKGLKNNNKIK